MTFRSLLEFFRAFQGLRLNSRAGAAFGAAFPAATLGLFFAAWTLCAQTPSSSRSSNQLLTGSSRSAVLAAASPFSVELARSAFAPFIIEGEDRFQSYIHDDALAVWVNVPSLRADGDTISVIVKRVVRRNVAHSLTKDLVYVDLLRFNTRDDTFASVASLNAGTGEPTLNPKPEWEKTTLDPDMNALYHFVGFLHDEKLKR